MRYSILTFNNYVGLLTDALILKDILKKITNDVDIVFLETINTKYKSNYGIWIQNYHSHLLENFKINIFYINEEWFDYPLSDLKKFDYVICKSTFAYNLIRNYCNAICIPFVSRDFYDSSILKSNSLLHFAGRSIQKNTELILKQKIPITLIDPYNRYKPTSNFNHINTYQSNESIIHLLNSHNIHICCSLYESWGHYLFEGLSTGSEIICSEIPVFKENLDPDLVHFIPTRTDKNLNYSFDLENKNNLYPLRNSFYIDENYFQNFLIEFTPNNKSEKRRLLFRDIIDKNIKKIIHFFSDDL